MPSPRMWTCFTVCDTATAATTASTKTTAAILKYFAFICTPPAAPATGTFTPSVFIRSALGLAGGKESVKAE